MVRMRYIGEVGSVGVPGKGIVRRGDVVEFDDREVAGLSNVNWVRVNIETFDAKAAEDKHVKKRVVKRGRFGRDSGYGASY